MNIGCLTYAITAAWHDIAVAVSTTSQLLAKPLCIESNNLKMLKQVLCYITGTLDYFLNYSADERKSHYVDSLTLIGEEI